MQSVKIPLTIPTGGSISADHGLPRQVRQAVAVQDPADITTATPYAGAFDAKWNTGKKITVVGTPGRKCIVTVEPDDSTPAQFPDASAAP